MPNSMDGVTRFVKRQAGVFPLPLQVLAYPTFQGIANVNFPFRPCCENA
jgi:hypothetical protein